MQRAMLTSWKTGGHEVVTRKQLETRAGRKLDDDAVARLVADYVGPAADDDRYEIAAGVLRSACRLLDLPIPVNSMVAAGEAINRHMEELADELTDVLKDQVLTPYLESPKTARPTRPSSSTPWPGCVS